MANTTKTPQEIRDHLDQFIGTTQYHKHPLGLLLTDGVVAACELMKCWWLTDVIASHQWDKKIKANPSFIVWRFVKRDDDSATVSAHSDWDDENPKAFKALVSQEIPFTNLPLDEFVLWQESGVLLLRSEH